MAAPQAIQSDSTQMNGNAHHVLHNSAPHISTPNGQEDQMETLAAPQPIKANSAEFLTGGGGGQGNGNGQGNRIEEADSSGRRDRRLSVNRLGPSPPPPPGPPPSEPPPLPPGSLSINNTRRSSNASSHTVGSSSSSQNPPPAPILRRTSSTQSALARAAIDRGSRENGGDMSSGSFGGNGNGGARSINTADLRSLGEPVQSSEASGIVSRRSSGNGSHGLPGEQGRAGPAQPTEDIFGSTSQITKPEHRHRTSTATSSASHRSHNSSSTQKPNRIPSKQLLQLALDLAQKAVELDRANDVEGALQMYREAVGRLRAVMERVGIEVGPVPSGLGLPELTEKEKEEAAQARRKRQTNGSVRPEEEGRTLRGIHDAYIARIGLLIVMQAAQKSPTITSFNQSQIHSRQDSDTNSGKSDRPSSTGGTSAIGNLMMSETGESINSNASTPVRPSASAKGKEVERPISRELIHGVFHPTSKQGDSVKKEVVKLYPPPISSPPQPRPRKTSLVIEDSELINHTTPPMSHPSINVMPETPYDGGGAGGSTSPKRRNVPIPTPEESGKSFGEGSESGTPVEGRPPLTSIPSAGSDGSLGSKRSAKRRSARESILRSESSGVDEELGVESEMGGEDLEVLSSTPVTGEHPGRLSSASLEARSLPSPSAVQFDGRSTSKRDPGEAPLISPRIASLSGLPPPSSPSSSSSQQPVLINSSPATASIMQRRRAGAGGDKQRSISSVIEEDELSYDVIRPDDGIPPSPTRKTSAKNATDGFQTFGLKPANFLGDWSKDVSKIRNESSLPARLRTLSQPGKRPPIPKAFDGETLPPLPTPNQFSPPGSDGFSSRDHGSHPIGSGSLSPPLTSISTTLPMSLSKKGSSLRSPLPEPLPINPLHRPFHLMRLISNSVQSPTGGYLSERLHIPRAMWAQTTVKVPALETKVRVVDLLTVNVLNVARAGDALLVNEEIGNEVRMPGREFAVALDEFEGLMDEVQKMLSKKLGLTNVKSKGGIGSFGSKFAKTLDKMTTGKNIESPTAYVESLSRLCYEAQILDRHLYCITTPSTLAYDSLSQEGRNVIEGKLKRVSEFFSQVVLAFVFQDIGLMLSKYLKHSTRWIED